MGLSLGMGLRISASEPHDPIDNPILTNDARYEKYTIDDLLSITDAKKNGKKKSLIVENIILNQWDYSQLWTRYLDKPLIAHVAAALELKDDEKFDAAVGVETAGIPYLKLLELAGMDTYVIDHSVHGKKSTQPTIDENVVNELQKKKKVLIVDIDTATGKTLRDVTDYFRNRQILVAGAYLGLSAWPGFEKEEIDCFSIGTNSNVNFSRFWLNKYSLLTTCKHNDALIDEGFLPADFKLYNACANLENISGIRVSATDKVAKYLINKNLTQNVGGICNE